LLLGELAVLEDEEDVLGSGEVVGENPTLTVNDL